MYYHLSRKNMKRNNSHHALQKSCRRKSWLSLRCNYNSFKTKGNTRGKQVWGATPSPSPSEFFRQENGTQIALLKKGFNNSFPCIVDFCLQAPFNKLKCHQLHLILENFAAPTLSNITQDRKYNTR